MRVEQQVGRVGQGIRLRLCLQQMHVAGQPLPHKDLVQCEGQGFLALQIKYCCPRAVFAGARTACART